MRNFNKISASEIKLGMRFSAPVFFDDGESMFLAENKAVKQQHITAIARWKISTPLTFGHVITEDEIDELEELDDFEMVEELEEI